MIRLIFLLGLMICGPAYADTIGSADRTVTRVLPSAVLGEAREVMIRTPVRYDEDAQYPVIYVLDGEWNLELVGAYFDYMADNGIMPPVIVTGIKNVNRNRDYLPQPDDDYPDSGGGDIFLDFVEQEWIVTIEEFYPASGERVLIGHSFGGVFTLFAFFERPVLFDAYIAISASAWISDRLLFDAAAMRFSDGVPDGRFVYMAPGEFDGGPTRPSGEALGESFAQSAPPNLDWTFSVIPGADHFKAFTGGLHEAGSLLFPAEGFAADVMAAGKSDGARGVRRWFKEKERTLGYRFFPSWFDFGVAAIRLSSDDAPDAAKELIKRTLPYHRDDANFAAFAARVYENAGELDRARKQYERALDLAEEFGLHPNVIHLDRLNAGLARIDAKQNAIEE